MFILLICTVLSSGQSINEHCSWSFLIKNGGHPWSESKNLVVEAAAEIISTEGLNAQAARKVASETGYSSGLLYNIVEDLNSPNVIANENTMRKLDVDLTKIVMTGDELAGAS